MTAVGAPYIGRFAPTPSGPLHLGSLVSALASWLDARAAGGRWLVRIEDLDPPREDPAATALILATLKAHSLDWDGPVLYQSKRLDAYAQAIDGLEIPQQVYRCRCSRRSVGPIYPGTCEHIDIPPDEPTSLRLKVPAGKQRFTDRLYGDCFANLQRDSGDFIIRRKDGLHAYQLAVVVDDHFQRVSHVVRGLDLLPSTPRQLALQDALALPHPNYAHHALVLGDDGDKLSKQTHAPAVANDEALLNLRSALAKLGLPPLDGQSCDALLGAALEAWPAWLASQQTHALSAGAATLVQ